MNVFCSLYATQPQLFSIISIYQDDGFGNRDSINNWSNFGVDAYLADSSDDS